MGKRRYHQKPGKFKVDENYASDDERAYKDLDQPDPNSRSYIYDEIDDFHEEREKIMLERGAKVRRKDYSDDEEVFPMDLSDDEEFDDDEDIDDDEEIGDDEEIDDDEEIGDDEEMDDEDDIESQEASSDSEKEEPKNNVNILAWGKKKRLFYGTNYIDKDYGGFKEADIIAAQEEEEEARALEKRLREKLDDNDFLLETFEIEKKPMEEGLKVEINIDKLSKKEKLSLLKKKYPEMLMLIDEFKQKMSEVKDVIQPLMALVKNGTILSKKLAQYIRVKNQLYLNYCINISFYMVLRARGTPTTNHPIIKRLATYKTLISQLEPLDQQLEENLSKILSSYESGDRIVVNDHSAKEQKQKKKLNIIEEFSNSLNETKDDKQQKKVQFNIDNDKANQEANKNEPFSEDIKEELYDGESEDKKSFDLENLLDANEKRAITYQIEKNKGLTPHRKKINRNPRVKLRRKFRKARIRRKGQVREPRIEYERYGGELSGIRTGVKKSIKIK